MKTIKATTAKVAGPRPLSSAAGSMTDSKPAGTAWGRDKAMVCSKASLNREFGWVKKYCSHF